jgi:iron complex outermembrane receptor protein
MYRDQVTQPAYRLLNARLDLTIKAWDINVALFGRNITAVKYFDQMLGPGLGTYFGYAAEPAIYGAEIIKKFGK